MRVRISSLVFAVAVALATFVLLFQVISLPYDTSVAGPQKEKSVLEVRLKKLEENINSNQETINEIKFLLKKLSFPDETKLGPGPNPNKFNRLNIHNKLSEDVIRGNYPAPTYNKSQAVLLSDDCLFSQAPSSSVDIQMKDVYDKIPFDNKDGGAWKQGWDITYQTSQWSPSKKLKVFVIPHSHNDPGWLKTFESYFQSQTKHILDNMVQKLPLDARRKFIWAEISYFSLWWNTIGDSEKEVVKKLLNNGQLEIVTGGWVMPDEANTHFTSLLDQLVTGHEWLDLNVNVKPNNGWSIDPFGMSPSNAYLLKRSGLENMLIQRTHYAVKKYLAKKQSLEFMWRQIWDTGSSTDILCHMMPFYSYDVPHTCGPDPKVCCQFDFKRLAGSGVTCPWRIPPQPINSHNVDSRSELLLDQYRKKSQLYKSNVLLVPLGDDFRYDRSDEWDNQYNNYQKLFDNMNNRKDLNVQAQFGTLKDYFNALRQESKEVSGGEEGLFPSLSGDFFSYADRDDHYWTGYFTTRPYYKGMERILRFYLRSAEILYSIMISNQHKNKKFLSAEDSQRANQLMSSLTTARYNLGLFQHHDGITGTAKDHVAIDYARKMLDGITSSQKVIQYAAYVLLAGNKNTEETSTSITYFKPGEVFSAYNKVKTYQLINIEAGVESKVILHNPEAHQRKQLVTLIVSSPYVQVYNEKKMLIQCQINPVINKADMSIFSDRYEVNFISVLESLSLTTYTIEGKLPTDITPKYTSYGKMSYKNKQTVISSSLFEVEDTTDSLSPFTIGAGRLKAEFHSNGLLSSVSLDGHKTDVSLRFLKYGARGSRETSGAYLFLPDGPAKDIPVINPEVTIIEGPLISSIQVQLLHIEHNIRVKNSPGVDGISLEVDNNVLLFKERNLEIIMRLSTSIQNKRVLYTDLNGLTMIKRVFYEKLPLQANYYPIPSQAFIQDKSTRLTILSKQPLGGASLNQGQLEIMQDRRLNQDDNRGLGQGITDNVLTLNSFKILIEKRTSATEESPSSSGQSAFPSLSSIASLNSLMNPIISLHVDTNEHSLKPKWSIGGSLPCDVQLINLRTMMKTPTYEAPFPPSNWASLTLHRTGFSCGLEPNLPMKCSSDGGKVRLNDLFPSSFTEEVNQMSLSLMYEGMKITKSYTLTLQPMELYAFKLPFILS